MITVDARGLVCPIPVVKTKDAIASLAGEGTVRMLVDNEVAVQNLTRFASGKGYAVKSAALGENEYEVVIEVSACAACAEETGRNVVIAVTKNVMGGGDETLGRTLLKSFLYAVAQQDTLPRTILFYNGGASVACEGSDSLEDLAAMEKAGVEILTCGTCLNFYGLSDKLKVGQVTNMYSIVEKLSAADLVIQP